MEQNGLKGWRYYNHALVPTCAPHEEPDTEALHESTIWHLGGGKALFARYTTDFDCKEETGFWYVVREAPYDIEDFDKKYKRHVVRALERTEARLISPLMYAEELWEVTQAAYAQYKNADNKPTKEQFLDELNESTNEWWGAFDRKTGRMAGWMSCANNGTWTDTAKAKYHPERQSWNRPSDVLHHAVLTHYLNELGQRYVCSGTRSVNHKTNVQEYKIKHWKFRKAYCHLHLVYHPKIRWVVKMAYPWRKILKLFDRITLVHQVNSLMILEEISRQKYERGMV